MPVVDVLNLDGKKVGQVELADAIFGAKVNQHLLHEVSRWYLRGLRAGTHKTKDKSEVSGAGRKVWRQKGTGRARVGSIRSPLWRHGGTVHGPRPRDYSYALPKKMLLGALRSALSSKLAEQKLKVVDAWTLDTHKTKSLVETLEKLNRTKSALLVAHGENRNLELASRSEEHTSELQSLAYLVCRLLLEKKKKNKTTPEPPMPEPHPQAYIPSHHLRTKNNRNSLPLPHSRKRVTTHTHTKRHIKQ